MTYEPVDIVAASWRSFKATEHPGLIIKRLGDWRDALGTELERLAEAADIAEEHAYRHAARLVKGQP